MWCARRPVVNLDLVMPANADIPVSLSDGAVERIVQLIDDDARPNAAFRVSVNGGGCSGFQYAFSVDEVADGDEVIERGGARVAIDTMSLMYLAGSEIDFVDEMIGSQFTIGNPNATSMCSCGSSFAV